MNKFIPLLAVVLVLGGLFFYRDKVMTLFGVPPATENSNTMQPASKNYAVSANEFAFSPATLTAGKGDMVTITFTNSGKYSHNFTISDLGVSSKTIGPGQSDTVTFTADKAGSFTYTCTVEGHADKGMTGTLSVQ